MYATKLFAKSLESAKKFFSEEGLGAVQFKDQDTARAFARWIEDRGEYFSISEDGLSVGFSTY